MNTLPSRTHGTLYLTIAQLLSESNPELAQQMTAAELADYMATSQQIMDATTPGQVTTIESMVKLVRGAQS